MMTGYLGKLLDAISTKKQREKRQIKRKEKLAQRDTERRTEGLLSIALRRSNSINSFTAADPGVYYRRSHEGEELDPWKRDRGFAVTR